MAKRQKAAPKRAPKKHRVSRSEGARLVRGVRRRLRLTQAALASRLGVAQMTVSRWEAGDAPLRPPMRLALANVVATVVSNRKLAAKALAAAKVKTAVQGRKRK